MIEIKNDKNFSSLMDFIADSLPKGVLPPPGSIIEILDSSAKSVNFVIKGYDFNSDGILTVSDGKKECLLRSRGDGKKGYSRIKRILLPEGKSLGYVICNNDAALKEICLAVENSRYYIPSTAVVKIKMSFNPSIKYLFSPELCKKVLETGQVERAIIYWMREEDMSCKLPQNNYCSLTESELQNAKLVVKSNNSNSEWVSDIWSSPWSKAPYSQTEIGIDEKIKEDMERAIREITGTSSEFKNERKEKMRVVKAQKIKESKFLTGVTKNPVKFYKEESGNRVRVTNYLTAESVEFTVNYLNLQTVVEYQTEDTIYRISDADAFIELINGLKEYSYLEQLKIFASTVKPEFKVGESVAASAGSKNMSNYVDKEVMKLLNEKQREEIVKAIITAYGIRKGVVCSVQIEGSKFAPVKYTYSVAFEDEQNKVNSTSKLEENALFSEKDLSIIDSIVKGIKEEELENYEGNKESTRILKSLLGE